MEGDYADNPIREAVISFLQNCPKNRFKSSPPENDPFKQYRFVNSNRSPEKVDEDVNEDAPFEKPKIDLNEIRTIEEPIIQPKRELIIGRQTSFERTVEEKKSEFVEKNLLALEIERKASVHKANCHQRIRINKHLNTLRERAEHELSQKLEALALARQEDERKLEELSQEILEGQLEASRQAQTQMQDQSKRIADQLKINKAENQRRDLISQASTVWREYNDTLSVCQGLQIPESGFNPEKMAAVFSEVSEADVSCLMDSTDMLDALRGQINLCHSHIEELNVRHQQNLEKKQAALMKAQEEALKIQKEQLELKEKQETALRAAQEKQAAKEAEEARAKQEALAQQAAAEAEKSATSESTVVAHQTESALGSSSGSATNLQMYEDLKSFKAEIKARVQPLEEEKGLRAKFLCQKAVNTPVNAISPTSSAHLKDKLERLQKLLRGEPVTVGTESVSTAMNPLFPDYVKLLVAKKFVAQGEEVISSKPETAFSMAAVIVALWAEFPDFGSLFLAYLYEACPYLVPHHPPYPREPSRAEYLALGYKYSEDDVIEEQPKFVKRMTGMARLWAAVTISGLPKGHESINHPHGLGQLWRWMASTLNMDPMNDVTATLIYDVLEVSGSELFAKYGNTFKKLLVLLCQSYFPKIQQVTIDGCGGPVMRLETFLQKAVTTGTIKQPSAALKHGFL